MAQVADSQAATAAGAFGGSRSGVSAALTNQLYDQDDQSNIAGLNQAQTIPRPRPRRPGI